MDLPIITAMLSDEPRGKNGQWPSHRQVFLVNVKALEDAIVAGTVGNKTQFNDIKDDLNRQIDHAWCTIADRYVYSGRYQTLPKEVADYWHTFVSHPSLHLMASCLKRSITTLDHPLCREVRAFLLELAPLADLYNQIKTTEGMIATRQPKPARVPGFHPPKPSTAGEKIVVDLLTEITAEAYVQLIAQLRASFVTTLDIVAIKMAAHPAHEAIAREHGIKLTAEEYFYYCEWHPMDSWSGVIHKAVTANGQRRDNWADIVDVLAIEVADDIRNAFVHKNFRKIASIVDAKGNYKAARVLSRTIDLNGLTGEIGFTFTDGSRFEVRNAVVHVHNSYGTNFRRFPLTFHNIIMPDGTRMRMPSEAKMNRLFVRRA